jgi:hypothetical protein
MPDFKSQEDKIAEILSVIDLDRLLKLAYKIKAIKDHKHGEVSLVIKNGEIVYIDVRFSEDLRKRQS